MKTFPKGIHVGHRKEATESLPIQKAPHPKRAVLPLQQSLGAPAEALVKVGDSVYEGQKIADSTKFISVPLHAPIAGKVTRIEKIPNASGLAVPSIVIEASDDLQGAAPSSGRRPWKELCREEIRTAIREAGIVGLGGATFPAHVKLSPPAEKKIDTVIINGCECEPYITADHRLMLERPEDRLAGAGAIARAVGAGTIILGIEDNKPDAIRSLQGALERE